MTQIKRIAVLIACHNRKNITLACLDALFKNQLPVDHFLKVFLVDDGSTDGTGEAVRKQYPQVNIIEGNGDLFWNRSMHVAFSMALNEGYDYYVWLNDDTLIDPMAISIMLQTNSHETINNRIIVGAISDPETGKFAYGGARQLAPLFRPFLCEYVFPNGYPQYLDVMNGNLVLIPDFVARKLENIDPVFEHAMGDTDYAMRARKLGVIILLTPDYIGSCERNKEAGSYRDKSLSVKRRFKDILSRKGLPWRSWLAMCWRHGGLLWPVHFLWGYVKVILGRD